MYPPNFSSPEISLITTHANKFYTFSECVDFSLKYSGFGDENLILKDKQIQTKNSLYKCYGSSHFVRHMTESRFNGFLGSTDEVGWIYEIDRVVSKGIYKKDRVLNQKRSLSEL